MGDIIPFHTREELESMPMSPETRDGISYVLARCNCFPHLAVQYMCEEGVCRPDLTISQLNAGTGLSEADGKKILAHLREHYLIKSVDQRAYDAVIAQFIK